jgi:cyclohexadienyl dehydratase
LRLRPAGTRARSSGTIFDQIASGKADLMMTGAFREPYQHKLHPSVLCAIHPDKPCHFAERAYRLQRDIALKAFVDQWLHIKREDGGFVEIDRQWFE